MARPMRFLAASVLLAAPLLAACTGDDDAPQISSEATTDEPTGGTGTATDRDADALQVIPSYEATDPGALGEQIGESWSIGMGGASAMTTAVLEGRPVVLSGSRQGDVEIFDLDTGEQAALPFTAHENALREILTAEVAGRTLVVSVEVGYAHVWELATGEPVGELDLGADYEVTTITDFQGKPAFVNAGKEIVVTDLASMETLEHYTYDLGLSAGAGDVIDIDERSILVAANTVGGQYGVGAWDLADGAAFHEYPMYEQGDNVAEMAVGYLDDTVLAVTGDFEGNLTAWDVAADASYGPDVAVDGSSIRGLAVVEVDQTLVGVVGTLDRTMAFWDVATGEMLLETDAPGLGFEFLSVSDLDGRPVLVAAGSGEIHRFWLG